MNHDKYVQPSKGKFEDEKYCFHESIKFKGVVNKNI